MYIWDKVGKIGMKNKIAKLVYVVGYIAAIVFGFAAFGNVFSALDGSLQDIIPYAILALSSAVFDGFIVWVAFRVVAELIELLQTIADK